LFLMRHVSKATVAWKRHPKVGMTKTMGMT
jgi:hypothetical protein